MKKPANRSLYLALGLIIFLCLPSALWAHNINYALENAPTVQIFGFYLHMGFTHIIPLGADHILFIAALCIVSTKLSSIVWQASAFTLAHTIALTLSIKKLIVIPGDIVEPIIALSILFVALENILLGQVKWQRLGMVFFFGLVHGLGFASALNETGLPPDNFINSLLAFNIGVELGQLLVILLVFFGLVLPFRHRHFFRSRIVWPVSAIIGIMAIWWTIERVFV